jgi:3-hydroxyacyl-[acyl-carrier-protein] dehydratase
MIYSDSKSRTSKNEIMLRDSLYVVEILEAFPEENKAKVVIRLNPSHSIFEGHFPGSPVLPGVCMIQITKELLFEIFSKKFVLSKAQTIKFQNPVNPHTNPLLTFAVTHKTAENQLFVNIQVSNEATNFCNIKAEFVPVEN